MRLSSRPPASFSLKSRWFSGDSLCRIVCLPMSLSAPHGIQFYRCMVTKQAVQGKPSHILMRGRACREWLVVRNAGTGSCLVHRWFCEDSRCRLKKKPACLNGCVAIDPLQEPSKNGTEQQRRAARWNSPWVNLAHRSSAPTLLALANGCGSNESSCQMLMRCRVAYSGCQSPSH